MKKMILIVLVALSLVPLVLGSQSLISIFGGDSAQVIHINNCSKINVSVTGLLRIDAGEYWFTNCSQRLTNLWNCSCNKSYDLIINTLPNTINTYNVTAVIINSTGGTCDQKEIYYCDSDKDGYISKKPSGNCTGNDTCIPKGCTEKQGNDCDDNNKNIHLGAKEVCDGKDNDCDGKIDEGCISSKDFCNKMIINNWHDYKGMFQCFSADWKDNEKRLFPDDCEVKTYKQGKHTIYECVPTSKAN